MSDWLRRLCRDGRGFAALEHGLMGLLVAIVIISGLQLLVSSGSQDLASPETLFVAPPAGS
ncbi:hypothetical protein E0493_16195 [Roseomonas sp. M0104]|uniref:Flp family type IVb pilin n=1 Tax=Teichococcus coralli TaxID=2545983 RepID=A0A845BFR5_9PROT|nr:hypothetical protein [Pseudoroseomonas coralli]MXP64894.1 hypothetical protein [Pseudoroseomonas coralli]